MAMVELLVHLHLKTGTGLKLSRTGDESTASWIPISSVRGFKELGNGMCRVSLPRYTAIFMFGNPLPTIDGKAALT
jgi:hypothetical protein